MVSYRTNAELSVLASAFIEDNNESFFRVYVPSGRIYADEADKLLALFHDYLIKVKQQRFRQDSYSTSSGQVYEFFRDEEPGADLAFQNQFDDFSRFLHMCVSDAPEAVAVLEATGLSIQTAEELVRRYGRDAKRLNIDLRHARESKLLALRQQLETDLVEAAEMDLGLLRTPYSINPETRRLHKCAGSGRPRALPAASQTAAHITVNQTVNQQIVGKIEGTVIQGLQGTANLNPPATSSCRSYDGSGRRRGRARIGGTRA